MYLPTVKEKMGIIKIEKGRGIHIDVSERSIDNKKNIEEEVNATVYDLLNKLKSISAKSDLQYVFGAYSKEYDTNIAFARGHKPGLDYMLRKINNDFVKNG